MKWMSNSTMKKGCARIQGLRDLLHTSMSRKNTLRKVICGECGKIF